MHFKSSQVPPNMPSMDDLPEVPHNEYPPDGMTQFCRRPPPSDNGSSVGSLARPISRDSQSDLSNTYSFTSPEPSLGASSPTKGMSDLSQRSGPDEEPQKKKSSFFANKSPFKRREKPDVDSSPATTPTSANRNSFQQQSTPTARIKDQGRPPPYGRAASPAMNRRSASPDPSAPQQDFQLNIGNSVFDVASPDKRRSRPQPDNGFDEVAQALAAVKDITTKQSTSRVSADRYAGLATPAPPNSSSSPASRGRPVQMADRTREAPPPSYNPPPPVSRLDAPQPAHTSRHMQQTTQSFQNRNSQMLTGAQARPSPYARPPVQSRPPSRGPPPDTTRAASPAPRRSPSPRPGQGNLPRAASPNPYLNGGREAADTGYGQPNRPRAHSTSPIKPRTDGYGVPINSNGQGQGPPRGAYAAGVGAPQQRPSPNQMPRAASPQPHYNRPSRPNSGSYDNMAMQLAPVPGPGAGAPQGYAAQSRPGPQGYPPGGAQPRGRMAPNGRPMSTYGAGPGMGGPGPGMDGVTPGHARSQSAGTGAGQFTPDGIRILHFCECSFASWRLNWRNAD